jgi:hypothetical protein
MLSIQIAIISSPWILGQVMNFCLGYGGHKAPVPLRPFAEQENEVVLVGVV